MNSEAKQRLIDALTLLSVPKVGKGRFNTLTRKFGSVSNVFDAPLDEIASINGISSDTARAIKNGGDIKEARQIAGRIEKLGWTTLLVDNPEYPTGLSRIRDYPPILFRLGKPTLPHEKMIAIVGTRRCSDESRRFARTLARDLTEAGLVVVSGMAEGIDGAAHRGALDASGKTVAVWGTSLDKVFPVSHKQLAQQIEESGTIYSEILPGVPTDPSFFPARNRIISAVSEGVIVVEASEKSGALITAEQALEQGKELFAVPGSPGSKRFIGSNSLIKQGANLVTEAGDIFRAIPRLQDNAKASRLHKMPELTEMERLMVDRMSDGPVHTHQAIRLPCFYGLIDLV